MQSTIETLIEFGRLFSVKDDVCKKTFDPDVSLLNGFPKVINLIHEINKLLEGTPSGKNQQLDDFRTYAAYMISVLLHHVIYYIRCLRAAPLTVNERNDAFRLIMDFLSSVLTGHYAYCSRAKCQALLFLLENQHHWNSGQMKKLKAYLTKAVDDQAGETEWLEQLINGNFSYRLNDEIKESSNRLVQQLKGQSEPSSSSTAESLDTSFFSPATENVLDRFAEFLLAYQRTLLSRADFPMKQTIQKMLNRMKLFLFLECYSSIDYFMATLVPLLTVTIHEFMQKEEKPYEALKMNWMFVVDLFEYLLTNNAFDSNRRFEEASGNSALQQLLLKCRPMIDGSSWEVKETTFFSLSRIIHLFITTGYNLELKNDEGKTAYDIIKGDEEMEEYLSPAFGKNVHRLESLAAKAVPRHSVPNIDKEIIYPTALIEIIKKNWCSITNYYCKTSL
jgi:hypothetical protein